MRLSGLRLRMPHLSFERFPTISGRFVLYAVYTIVLFLIFLIANFPHHVLVRRALDSLNLGPVHLDVEATRFAWWKGYELRSVRLIQADAGLDMPPLLESRSLYVRPGLSGLLRGELSSVRVSGVMYNGDVVATWVAENGGGRITLSMDSLEIGRYPLITGLLEEGQILGRISGFLSIEPRGTGIAGAEAAGELSLQNGRLAGARIRGLSIPDLNACSADAKLGLKGGRVDIQEFHLECDEVKVTATGNIATQPRLPESRLNLRLTTEPGRAPPDEWKVLAPLVPCGVSGTVAHLRTQPCTASQPAKPRRR
jgi:type II secretion system protein N